MDRSASTTTTATPLHLYAAVADLGRYPEWLGTVSTVEPTAPDDDDPGPAWLVTLTARVGLFKRSKRLRMVRAVAVEPERVRFERRELDRKDHAPWTLDAEVSEHPDGSEVTVHLHYEGGLWDPILETVLGAMIADAIPNLRQLVEQ